MNRPAESHSHALRTSWDLNAQLWTAAVRESTIASRAAATDQAIVDAVIRCKPRSVIDIGCGEGWLVRRLSREHDCNIIGLDGSEQLIQNARTADPDGVYMTLAYDQLGELSSLAHGPFDVAICNFALLEEDISTPLGTIQHLLTDDGSLIIQTLHPWSNAKEQPYGNGWREETFDAFAANNWQPMPWYFRTLGSWVDEIKRSGMHLTAVEEPLDPSTFKPLSLVLVCAAN